MEWQPPTFEEINMSAEIGAYDGDDRGDWPRTPEVPADAEQAG